MRSREKVIWCVCVLSAAVGYYLYAVYAAKKESKRLARVIYLCRSSVIGAPAGKPFSYDMDEYLSLTKPGYTTFALGNS